MTQRLYGGIGYLLFGLIALAAQDGESERCCHCSRAFRKEVVL
jgi:hypothetical protein